MYISCYDTKNSIVCVSVKHVKAFNQYILQQMHLVSLYT